jgi:hypothetical protein
VESRSSINDVSSSRVRCETGSLVGMGLSLGGLAKARLSAAANEARHFSQSILLSRPVRDKSTVSDLAFHLAGAGIDTHVITSRQLYEEPDAQLPSNETVRGVHIHRVATTSFGRSSLSGRSVGYVSYYLSTWRSLFALTRPGDMVIAMTDPPLISLFAMPVVSQRRAFLINWLQDMYPETARGLLARPLTEAGRLVCFWRTSQTLRS